MHHIRYSARSSLRYLNEQIVFIACTSYIQNTRVSLYILGVIKLRLTVAKENTMTSVF